MAKKCLIWRNISQTKIDRFQSISDIILAIKIQLMTDFYLDDLCSVEINQPHPQTKFHCSTADSDKHQPLCFLDQEESYHYPEESLQLISDATPYEVEPDIFDVREEPVMPPKKPKEISENKKVKKNSNAIKKMGRIILKRIKDYQIGSEVNTGVEKMIRMLEQRCKDHSRKGYVDGFNTYHLQALFDIKEQHISRFNLKTTRKIFTEMLRKEVLDSYQIKGEGKSLYLTTLKCSSLRFMNKRLAYRLQNSENPLS